jgi:Zn finger protein HypA/HybF involved in hydrogenase expression
MKCEFCKQDSCRLISLKNNLYCPKCNSLMLEILIKVGYAKYIGNGRFLLRRVL